MKSKSNWRRNKSSYKVQLFIWATDGKSSFHVYAFLKEVLKYCENKPEIVVDKGFWYKWVLNRLGLNTGTKPFGKRNAVERFFSLLKSRTRRFFNRFPYGSSFGSIQSWLENFMMFYYGGVVNLSVLGEGERMRILSTARCYHLCLSRAKIVPKQLQPLIGWQRFEITVNVPVNHKFDAIPRSSILSPAAGVIYIILP